MTAIQSVTDDEVRRCGAVGELPLHLRDLVDQTSGDLDGDQRRRLVEVFVGIYQYLSLSRGSHLLVTRTRWSMTSIRATGRPSGVPTSDVASEDEERRKLASQRC